LRSGLDSASSRQLSSGGVHSDQRAAAVVTIGVGLNMPIIVEAVSGRVETVYVPAVSEDVSVKVA